MGYVHFGAEHKKEKKKHILLIPPASTGKGGENGNRRENRILCSRARRKGEQREGKIHTDHPVPAPTRAKESGWSSFQTPYFPIVKEGKKKRGFVISSRGGGKRRGDGTASLLNGGTKRIFLLTNKEGGKKGEMKREIS